VIVNHGGREKHAQLGEKTRQQRATYAKGAQSAVLPQYEANTAATQEGLENRSQTKSRVDLKHANIG
jgi:hypothetical protein